MELLFADKERTDTTPSTHTETEMQFLERSGSPEADARRKILNNWFLNYPPAERKELKIRLETSFTTALYELFVHELFIKQGFKLHIHPEVPGTTKRPDFLASKEGIELYIEATEASEFSQEQKGIDNKTKVVWDILNKTNSPNFFLNIFDHRFKSINQPKGKEIIRFLEQQISCYSIDQIHENLKADYDERIRIKYEDDDFVLVVSLIPKPPELVGLKDVRSVGMYASEEYVSPEDSIKKSVEKKAGRYGNLDKPLLVCVNTGNSLALSEHMVFDILFGQLAITWSANSNDRAERAERLWQGVIGNPKNPKVKRASAILFTGLNLSTVVEPKHWLFKHPFATKPIDLKNFSLTYCHVENNRIQTVEKETVKSILFPGEIMK